MDNRAKAILILRVLAGKNPMLASEIWMKINGEERIHQITVRRMLEVEMLRREHVSVSGSPKRWEITPLGREWLRRNDKRRGMR